MKTLKKPGARAKRMALAGAGACALCCALPVIGVVGGTGMLATLGFYAEKIALTVLIISAGLFAFWLYRKNRAASCSLNCSCKMDNEEADQPSQSLNA